jgi:hypothetical protein
MTAIRNGLDSGPPSLKEIVRREPPVRDEATVNLQSHA